MEGYFLLHYLNEVARIMVFLKADGQEQEQVEQLSGFEPVTCNRKKLLLSRTALYQQSYCATCNEWKSIVSFLLNHLVGNFMFTQYL